MSLILASGIYRAPSSARGYSRINSVLLSSARGYRVLTPSLRRATVERSGPYGRLR